MKPFVPAILWAVLVFILSTMPGIQLPETIFTPDKLGHLAVYSIFNWLAIRGLAKRGSYSTKTAILATMIVASYGVAMEFVQGAFFPNRFFEVWDMVANFIGAVVGYIAFNFHFTKK